jgi:hypothetical protein
VREYKKWLSKKLKQYKIDRHKLIAIVIVVERALGAELERRGYRKAKPFYRLWDDDGKTTRAWVHAAELAIWLAYNNFKADPYTRAIIKYPVVERFIYKAKQVNENKQVPLHILFPSARANTDRLKEYSDFYKQWSIKH